MAKKEERRRRSLNDRLDAELASTESISVAGITTETPPQTKPSASSSSSSEGGGELITKRATTIMPKEVFAALQRYCTDTDTPKHRALYLFILDGLHAAGTITDSDYQRFRDMAALLTTTYEKK